MTWDPCDVKLWTLSTVTASPPPNTTALGPNDVAAASWVATASVPAAVTVSLAGEKRRTEAEELPPTRPPRTRIVWPSATATALDTAAPSPFAMALTFSVGAVAADSVDVTGTTGSSDEPAPVGVGVAVVAGRRPFVPTFFDPMPLIP